MSSGTAQHDPKGPADPERGQVAKRQCTARSRTSGKRCGQIPAPGQQVCHYHGGAAPQAKRKAALRLIELVDPAIAVLAREMTNQNAKPGDRLRAAENVLDRAGYPRRMETDTDTAKQVLLQRLMEIRDSADPSTGSDPEPEEVDTIVGEIVADQDQPQQDQQTNGQDQQTKGQDHGG